MSPRAFSAKGYAAGVTVYKPDEAILMRLLARLVDDGVPVFVHVDGPAGEAANETLLAQLRSDPNLTLLQAERNGGIGAALNRLASAAIRNDFRRVLFLDQDSDLPAGTADALAASFDAAAATGRRVAVVGPRPVAPQGEASQPPRYRRRRARSGDPSVVGVDFLITSGSLVSLDAWREIGPFREDYFIDAIDVEWCFRAWDRGRAVLLDERLELPHRIGGGIVRFGFLAFPEQPERRMLTYVRNQAHMLRLAHVPLRWKARTLLYVPAQVAARSLGEPGRFRRALRMARAAAAGLCGRLVPADDER